MLPWKALVMAESQVIWAGKGGPVRWSCLVSFGSGGSCLRNLLQLDGREG